MVGAELAGVADVDRRVPEDRGAQLVQGGLENEGDVAAGDAADQRVARGLAAGETVILLHPHLPLVGASTVMERRCQQNDSLADG